MNAQKAREYFSAYREGSLDKGLKQALERKFQEDGLLRAEYQAFERALKQLEGLKSQPIEVPIDLHERISARLDKHVYETKRSAKPGLIAWWRQVAYGGVAVVAIVGAVFAVRAISGGGGSGADLFGTGGKIERQRPIPVIVEAGGKISVRFDALRGAKVQLRDGMNGPIVETLNLDDAFERELSNNSVNPSETVIETADGTYLTTVVLPGSVKQETPTGNGTVLDCAKAISARFGVAVHIEGKPTDSADWSIAGTDPVTSVTAKIQDKNASIVKLSEKLYRIR